MNLVESLALGPREIISLVGGGGKTTLMFLLARELSVAGCPVITTTTTKIYEPLVSESPRLILEENEETLLNLIQKNLAQAKHLTVAKKHLPENKLAGILPELIQKMDTLRLAPYIIIEADGAKHHSLKAPNTTEPVIPGNTTLVIPVVGIEVLGKKLTDEFVFRAEMAAKLLGLQLGSIVTPQGIAALLTHSQGIAKGSPPKARIIPFINKMDLERDSQRGRDLAREILKLNHPQIERVILGQASSAAEPVREVINQLPQ